MKKFTKALSVVLAVMMIMCTISAFSFTASAAETTTTIYFAAPTGTSTANTWSSVSLYYGSTTTMSDMTQVALSKTGKVYSGSKGSLTTITSGSWEVFSVTLTSAQVSAINNSKYVGFVNQNSRKTALKDSIRKATTSGTYATTDASIATFNGKMFVINGSNDSTEIGSYTVKVVNSTGNTPSSATIYFAAPNGTSTANTWSSVSLYYGSTTTMSDMTQVALSKTGNIYEGSNGSLTTITSGNWAVFSVKLTSAQIEAIDSSKYVGFVNQNSRKTALKDSIRKATASGTYASTDASIATFSGKMFVINGSNDSTEIGSYTVKVVDSTGKKISSATIYFAAPRGTSIANTWKSVQLYYGSTSTVGALKRIDMKRTGKVYAGSKGSLTTLVSDDWDVYSLTLTEAQIEAIDKESYVGFINVYNRKTGLKNSITKATESGTYASTKSSIAAYDGKMFVINGSYDTSSEFTTYTVKVVNNNTGVAPAKPATTIYFAAPLGTGTANTWSTVSFYYGNESNMSDNTKIAMTKTGDTYAGNKGSLTTLVSGNWDIYSVTLNSEQINRADYAKYVGFVNGYSRKTGYLYPLQKATESGTYADVPKSIADYDGKMFVICGSYQASEISYYTVKAVDYKASETKYTVKATSNVGTASSCTYSASNNQVTVTYTLKSSMLMENIQAVVSYDSSVLKLASTNSKKTISPGFYGTTGGGFEANLGLKNMIKFNATNPDGYDFTSGQTVFTAVFDIVGTGDTTVDLDVYVLTATENNKDIKLVYRDDLINDNFTLTAKATV